MNESLADLTALLENAPHAGGAKLADEVYEEILRQIVNGVLAEGARLPSETELAATFRVSRPVVREALSRLRADKVIVSRRGSGSYVQRRPSREFFDLANKGTVADLMRCFEFRIALEGEAAALAARRRDAQDLARIEQAFAELNGVIERGEVGVEADVHFHRAIAAATRNTLFTEALAAFDAHTFRGITLTRRMSLRASKERVLLVQREHQEIVEAIRNEDAEAARKAMRRHIDNARMRVLSDSVEP